ncbi:MAG TPA: hypothetical protein VJV79_24930 [Polyangiaceae bacterium]|nr:hypothetical protein [Polyangiaceae bacterium]
MPTRRYPTLLFIACTFTLAACSTSDPTTPNSGGAGSGKAGSTAAGGSTATGGNTATGGTGIVGSAGTLGSTGGVPGVGGSPLGQAGGSSTAGAGSSDGITGYFTSGTWKGFAWTATFGVGGTVTPASFEGVATWPVCAKGTVKGVDDGSNGAMVGWNLNQEKLTDAPLGTIIPSKAGITVNVKAAAAATAQLRLQIQAADGETNALHRWCAEIGTGGEKIFVPWASFNTECWPGGAGVAYDGVTPLAQTIVQVPSAETDVTFDFCINSVAETDASGSTGTGCDLSAPVNGTALTGTLGTGDKYARKATNTGSPVINVQNNIFGSGGQYDIAYNGPSFTITNFTGSAPTSGAPMGYPSLFIGSSGGNGQATTGSNLAKQVMGLTDIPTAWRWSGSGTQFNAAYDVWFAPGSGDAGPGTRSFLMVWFHKTSEVFAEGEGESHSGGVATINGKSFNTYVSQQFEGRPIISYVASASIKEWSFDLNDFITDAKTRTSTAQPTPVISNNLYLTNVFAGFEVWSGATNLKTDKFCIEVK